MVRRLPNPPTVSVSTLKSIRREPVQMKFKVGDMVRLIDTNDRAVPYNPRAGLVIETPQHSVWIKVLWCDRPADYRRRCDCFLAILSGDESRRARTSEV